eukprot:6460317-Alexandrium_andersonii.AAC.1
MEGDGFVLRLRHDYPKAEKSRLYEHFRSARRANRRQALAQDTVLDNFGRIVLIAGKLANKHQERLLRE